MKVERRLAIFLIIFVVGISAYMLLNVEQIRSFTRLSGPVGMPELKTNMPAEPLVIDATNDLSIESLRTHKLQGSELTIEEELAPGSNYERYIASYVSEGNKIFGLLTIPQRDSSAAPQNDKKKFPVIIFNHGYIPPAQYRTTERYVAYVDGFARNGYIVFKSDYRGHGDSEGEAVGGYGSNAYTLDVLNALEAVKKHPNVDPERVGMWGHSMGGFITLRSMVVRDDIKAGVIWAGVVASYPDLINNWRRNNGTPRPSPTGVSRRWRDVLTEQFGAPSNDSPFWQSISANFFLSDISGPIQLHHGTADSSVPVEFSENLAEQLDDVGKSNELYVYPGDDHNIATNFGVAMQRSIDFVDKYVKE